MASQALPDEILHRDPTGTYPHCDYATRKRYVRAVVELARWSGKSPPSVAEQAVALASRKHSDRERHVGCCLIAELRPELEKILGCRLPWRVGAARLVQSKRNEVYLGSIGVLLGAAMAATLTSLHLSPAALLAIGALTALPMLRLSKEVMDAIVLVLTYPPKPLPKLEFRGSIPIDLRTLVVHPTLIEKSDDVLSILEMLALNYGRNRETNLAFALLTDFGDAPQQQMPSDAALLEQLQSGIRSLNEQFGSADRRPFCWFHRSRQWCESERRFMGSERKRGKLEEFNRLLAGDSNTTFVSEIGDRKELDQIRFVITLDADTQLLPGTAARLIAALAHPLNRPVIDRVRRRVIAGYGILQPKNEKISCRSEGDLFEGAPPILKPNVYQDLFDEALYLGKAIYDVEAFRTCLDGAIPPCTVLSHDKLEGMLVRTGFASDITVLDELPASLLAGRRRAHRWVRGDYQLIPWLFSDVPHPSGKKRNPLGVRARFQLFDDLVAPARFICILAVLAVVWLSKTPGNVGLWTLAAVALLGGLVLQKPLSQMAGPPHLLLVPRNRAEVGIRLPVSRVKLAAMVLLDELRRWMLQVVFLVDTALLAADAMTRTLYRMAGRQRGMLEWTTAASAARAHAAGCRISFWRQMIGAPVTALLLGGVVLRVRPEHFWYAAPLLALWFVSPHIAFQLDQAARNDRSGEGRERHPQSRGTPVVGIGGDLRTVAQK